MINTNDDLDHAELLGGVPVYPPVPDTQHTPADWRYIAQQGDFEGGFKITLGMAHGLGVPVHQEIEYATSLWPEDGQQYVEAHAKRPADRRVATPAEGGDHVDGGTLRTRWYGNTQSAL